MSVQIVPMSEVTDRARNALIQELGVVNAIRFLSQFRGGSGNYTAERDKLFQDQSVKEILAEIKASRGHAAQ